MGVDVSVGFVNLRAEPTLACEWFGAVGLGMQTTMVGLDHPRSIEEKKRPRDRDLGFVLRNGSIIHGKTMPSRHRSILVCG